MSGHDTPLVRCAFRDASGKVDDRIQYILRAIASDPSSDIAALARLVDLSPSRLSHLFKRETRRSLHSFLSASRLKEAAQLLAHTQTPVKEVSYIVGYRHAASFVRAFRKKFGCTPKGYRVGTTTFATEDSCFG